MNPTTSLLDRANLDRDSVRHQMARGLEGADDGELLLESSQTEALMFDNGRLKQATYDTSQGFGLRAVKDDAVGYAHSSDVSLPALIRAADAVAAVRGGYSGSFAAPPAHTNVRLYSDDNPLDAPGFETKVKLLAEIDAYLRDKDPRVRQVSVRLGATWQVVEILRDDGRAPRIPVERRRGHGDQPHRADRERSPGRLHAGPSERTPDEHEAARQRPPPGLCPCADAAHDQLLHARGRPRAGRDPRLG